MKFSFDEFLEGLWDATRSQWIKWVHKNLSDNHCEVCLKLDNCWFLRTKAPPWPHHPHCHCALEPISYNIVLKNLLQNLNLASSTHTYLIVMVNTHIIKKNYLTVGDIPLMMQNGYKMK